jgi:cysteinyl-tRNA synthetase
VPQVLDRACPAAVRVHLAAHHYHRDWDFTWAALDRASALCDELRELVAGVERPQLRAVGRRRTVREFCGALEDNLDTPRALRSLRQAVREHDADAAAWMLGILAGDAEL